MGQILGPYSRPVWNTMLLLKKDRFWMMFRDPLKFSTAISKERKLLKEYIRGEVESSI